MSRRHNICRSRQHEATPPQRSNEGLFMFPGRLGLGFTAFGKTGSNYNVSCDGRVGRWRPHLQVSARPPGDGRRRAGPVSPERRIPSAFQLPSRNPRFAGVLKLGGFGAVTYGPIRKQTEQKNSFLRVRTLDGVFFFCALRLRS